MSNPETEPNWDTEEMGRWIANDPVLYAETMDPDRPFDLETTVRNWAIAYQPDGFDVTLSNVDWEAVI